MYKCAEIIRNSRVSFWGNGKNLGQNHGPMIFQLAMSYFINHSHDHLVMTNIAMENPLYMEVSSWENHLFLWAMDSMAMLNNPRVNLIQSHLQNLRRNTSIPFFKNLRKNTSNPQSVKSPFS